MPVSPDRAWFRRRKYGIGWALHKSWQGWLLAIAYLSLAGAGVARFEAGSGILAIYLISITVCAIGLCWWKGEKSIARGNALDDQKNA